MLREYAGSVRRNATGEGGLTVVVAREETGGRRFLPRIGRGSETEDGVEVDGTVWIGEVRRLLDEDEDISAE